MGTGTCGGSETSLNTVVHENVKVYMNQYVKFFTKFTLNSYFYKLYKFVKIVFDTYMNFVKLSSFSKIFWKAKTKFKIFYICKVYTNSFMIYPSFLNIFAMILKFPRSFSKYSSIFFSKFQQILLKINTYF